MLLLSAYLLSQVPAVSGHDITVLVTVVGAERISKVRTVYDSKVIGNDSLKPLHSWYKREFANIGGFTPGVTHTVLVEVTCEVGEETASLIWTDQ